MQLWIIFSGGLIRGVASGEGGHIDSDSCIHIVYCVPPVGLLA